MNTVTQAQHTPGPWRLTRGVDDSAYVWGDTRPVLNIVRQDSSVEDYDANLRVIAAAPLLLGVLQGVLKEMDGPFGEIIGPQMWIEAVRAVIAKATGDAS